MGGEIGLYPGEPCDLGAINVSNYVVDGKLDYNSLENDSHLCAEYLDLILDAENPPLQEIADAIQDKRRIGLGMMGLADTFIKLEIPYDSRTAQDMAARIANTIMRGALSYSESPHVGISAGCERAGLDRRNIALTTVAPTGTTAMLAGTTSGIEPLFAPFIYRRVGTEYMKVLHPLFKDLLSSYLAPEDLAVVLEQGSRRSVTTYWDWDKVTSLISQNHGSVQGLEEIPTEIKKVFVCAHDIDPIDHVRMQAAVQFGFDHYDHTDASNIRSYAGNSVSKTINLPKEATVQDVMDVLSYAWRSGCKGITVYRDGSREFQVLSTSMDEDDGSSAESQRQDEQIDEIVAASCALDGTCE